MPASVVVGAFPFVLVYLPAYSGCVPALLGSLSHVYLEVKLLFFLTWYDVRFINYHSYLWTDEFIIYIYFIFAGFFKNHLGLMCFCYTEKNIENSLSLSLSLSLSYLKCSGYIYIYWYIYLKFSVWKTWKHKLSRIIDDSTMVQNVQFTMQLSVIQWINNLPSYFYHCEQG